MKIGIEKYKNASLKNLSNNLYKYLKKNNDERVNISESFSFEDYKSEVRMELVQFCSNFIYSVSCNSNPILIAKYAKLKDYIDDILDNEDVLDNYTVYKIQQFINRVAKDLISHEYESFKTVSKKEKYLEYKDLEIDTSRYLGFVSADKVMSYLYDEFGLKRINADIYNEALSFRNDDINKNNPDFHYEINKILFEAGCNLTDNNQLVIGHPVEDDDTIFKLIAEGCVAKKKPKKVYKKVVEFEEMEEIFERDDYKRTKRIY